MVASVELLALLEGEQRDVAGVRLGLPDGRVEAVEPRLTPDGGVGHRRNSVEALDVLAETELEIRLERTWSAVLALRDSEGEPIADAEVIFHKAGDPWGASRGESRAVSRGRGEALLLHSPHLRCASLRAAPLWHRYVCRAWY